jgi:hypothetical protein
MQRCLQRSNDLSCVKEVRFDALSVTYQRNAVRVLASLLTKDQETDEPFQESSCQVCNEASMGSLVTSSII